MEKIPVVSMFIPTLKEGKTIRKVIQNLKNSSNYKTEIIVVDGHPKRWNRRDIER